MLRVAEPSEVPTLTALSKAAFDTDVCVGGTEPGGPPQYDDPAWHEEMRLGGHLFAFEAEGRLLGGAVLFLQGTTLIIGRIFVDPAVHRQGYGLQLMAEIEDFFPDAAAFTLDTPVWNTRTNRFYRKLGYQEVSRSGDEVLYRKERNS